MFDFLQSLVDSISFLFSFIGTIFTGLFQFLMMIPQMLLFVSTMSAFVPTFLLVFFTASISTALILVVIGRKS